jgi:hypothetical protein
LASCRAIRRVIRVAKTPNKTCFLLVLIELTRNPIQLDPSGNGSTNPRFYWGYVA